MNSTLKRPLKPDDRIYFLHFLNTGGRAFLDILSRPFPDHQVLSLTAEDVSNGNLRVDPEVLENCRLIHGRFDADLRRKLPGSPQVVTMLRDPVRRTIASYDRLVRRRTGQRIGHLLQHASEADPWVVNPQARRIAGGMHLTRRVISDRALLDLAIEHLEQFAFFGLTERFSDSVQLLTYTFGWPPVLDPPDRRRLREPRPEDRLDREVIDRIRELTHVDAALYSHALALFKERVTRMADDLLGDFYQINMADDGQVRRQMDTEQLVAALIMRGDYQRAARLCGKRRFWRIAGPLDRIVCQHKGLRRLYRSVLSKWNTKANENPDC